MKHEQKLDCGGGYVKILPSTADQATFGGDTPYQMAMKCGLWETADVLKKSEVRRKKLAGGGTRMVPFDTPYWEPPAFSAKRMNPRGQWGPGAGS